MLSDLKSNVFDVSQQLGKGTYGEVSAATHRETGQRRAIKVILRSKIKNWDRFQTEVKILQTLVRVFYWPSVLICISIRITPTL